MVNTATIILNRNLCEVTDSLYESIQKQNKDKTDIYVVESGSEENRLSKYCSWWANWSEAMEHGLRYPRGFNYGLTKLWEENKFYKYKFYFFIVNDIEFSPGPLVSVLEQEMDEQHRLGVLMPCSRYWGEHRIIGEKNTKYFWYAHLQAWFVRREFIESVMETQNPTYMNFFFDGTNFRGYESDVEIIAKGYANDWATGITTKVWADENEEHLKTKADLIKTEANDENRKKVFEESRAWMRRKYGFNHKWSMQVYAKSFYDKFFEFYPQYFKYKI